MTIPLWTLLGFAAWTLLLLVGTVGVYRWSRILTRRQEIREFRADRVEGADWYRRAMRAHANCVENLPVYGAIVLVLTVTGIGGPVVDAVALAVLGARVVQSLIHALLVETNLTVSLRFTFFAVQLLAFLVLIGIVVARVGETGF